MDTTELFTLILHTSFDSMGMLLNATLFYLVIFRTPVQLKLYSILIGNAAVTDFLACFFSFLIQQRIIPIGRSLIYFSNGPCRLIGTEFCYITYCAMMSCQTHSLYSLLLSFSFRHYVLKRQHPTAQSLKLVILLISIPSMILFVIACFANGPAAELITILVQKMPEYDIVEETISGHPSIMEWRTLTSILLIATPVIPILLAILMFRRRIMAILSKHSLSEHTEILHKQLLKALTYQSLLPGLFFLALLCYLCSQLDLYHHPFLESLTLSFLSCYPVLSPVMSLWYIRSYRQRITQYFPFALRRISSHLTVEPSSRPVQRCFSVGIRQQK
ncbi:hypothetical protein V3C99_007031 [Haemonchus contortus]